jgi:hypothetical protein
MKWRGSTTSSHRKYTQLTVTCVQSFSTSLLLIRTDEFQSRRQYTSKFEKWGLRTYNTTKSEVQPTGTFASTSGFLSQGSGTTASQNMLASADATKRPLSVQSRDSMPGLTVRPVVPPKKKQKLEAHLAQRKDSDANLALALNDTEMRELHQVEAQQSPATSPKTTIPTSKPAVPSKKSQIVEEYLARREDPYANLALAFKDTRMRELQQIEAQQSPAMKPKTTIPVSKPAAPLKTRQNVDGYLATRRDPYAHLAFAFEDTEMREYSSTDVNKNPATVSGANAVNGMASQTSYTPPFGNSGSYSPAYGEAGPSTFRPATFMSNSNHIHVDDSMNIDDPFGDPNALTPTPSVFMSEVDNNLSDQADDDWEDIISGLSISTNEPLVKNGHNVSQFSLPGRWSSVHELARIARQVDPNRLIDTFTEDEITDMKRAADYLYALAFDDEASYLYAILIKRHQADGHHQHRVAFATIIAYAYAANTKGHFEIVENLLDTELKNDTSVVTTFFTHMMLAFTYARQRKIAKATEHLEMAQRYSREQDIFALLPCNDRSFDLIAYQSIVRCRSLPGRALRASDVNRVTQSPERLHEQKMDLLVIRDLMLQRVPGPFEFEEGQMKNPCIRSCLRWCINELESMTSVPGIWKNGNRKSRFAMIAEVVATFTCLWDRSQNPQSKLTDSSLTIWITEAEPRMGISPTHLLMFVCCMANSSSVVEWQRSKSSTELIKNLQYRFELHMNLGDTDLATSFLDTFNPHNSFDAESSERHACFGPWSAERNTFQSASRAHILDILRKVLMVILPEEKREDGSLTPRQSFSSSFFPTLAPALDSPSLLRMRGGLQDGLQQSMQSISSLALNAGANFEPSSFINQIGEALRRSLTSTESPRTSISTQSQQDSVSSSLRELLAVTDIAGYFG